MLSCVVQAAAAAADGARVARRQQLVNWMMLLQRRLGLEPETLHLGVQVRTGLRSLPGVDVNLGRHPFTAGIVFMW